MNWHHAHGDKAISPMTQMSPDVKRMLRALLDGDTFQEVEQSETKYDFAENLIHKQGGNHNNDHSRYT